MNNNLKICLLVLCSILVGVFGAWFFMSGNSKPGAIQDGEMVLSSKSIRSGNVKKITEISVDKRNGKRSVRIVEAEEVRPNVFESVVAEDGEGKLTELQRLVLKEIQDALDADDLKALRKALKKFTAGADVGGLGGYAKVPKSLRSAAVQALGWFGKEALVDLVDFMADVDEEVSSDAFDQFEQAIQDCTLSDRERAEMVKMMAKALTDPDHIDTLISTLTDMRPSVKGETAAFILTEGSPLSQAVMQDQTPFYFDDEVQTVDGIKKWLAENPDDPDDEEFYGGGKD